MIFMLPAWAGGLLFILFLLAALLCFYALILAIVAKFAAVTMIFSSVTAAVVLSWSLSEQYSLFGTTGNINLTLWAALLLGVLYIISLFPKVYRAIKCLCTTVIAMVCSIVFVVAVVGFIFAMAGKDFSFNATYDLVVRILCVLFTIVAMIYDAIKEEPDPRRKAPGPISLQIQRIIASIIYSAAITLICISSLSSGPSLSALIGWCIFSISAMVFYLIDLLLVPLAIKLYTKHAVSNKAKADSVRVKQLSDF